MIPMLLLILAVLSAAAAVFGSLPGWTQFQKGLDLIVFSTRFHWLLIGLSLVACLSIVGLVVIGKRRVWWLFGLAPVMALFIYGVANNPMRAFSVLDADESMFEKADVTKVSGEEWVLGIELDGQAFAYPYSRVYSVPVIVQCLQEKRFVLIWSPFANHAVARRMTLDLHARDLELASMPANVTLVHEKKYGQFISGANGLKLDGAKPNSLGADIPVRKTTFEQWKLDHPRTLVLKMPANDPGGVPTRPIKPFYPVPQTGDKLSQDELTTSVCVAPTTRPFAVLTDDISSRPSNLNSPEGALVMFKEEKSGKFRAFSRKTDEQVLRFILNKNELRKNVYMVDVETGSGWNIKGEAIDGPLAEKNQRLASMPLYEGCYWGVMQFWMSKKMGVSDLVLLAPDFRPASITGKVFEDPNNDGDKQPNEQGFSLPVRLRGKDDLGQPIDETLQTPTTGVFEFKGLRPGVYSITVPTASGYKIGKKSLGNAGGKLGTNSITEITLKSGVDAQGYHFAQVKR